MEEERSEEKKVIDRFCAALFSALIALLSRVIMNECHRIADYVYEVNLQLRHHS